MTTATTSCLFLKFLINTSRIFWKEEETRQLTDEENAIEQKNLINKLYALGYLIFRYKDPSRPWMVWSMENKVTDENESHGGSGKSIFAEAPKYFMQYVILNGRNPRLTQNDFLFERVTNYTDYVLIDDCNRYFDMGFFFPFITGDGVVNRKSKESLIIGFDEFPKMHATSNFSPHNIDDSIQRRLLYTSFSDYYHHGPNEEFNQARTPKDDFGKNLFTDFNDTEWNLFFNTCAQAVKLYLNYEKIDAPGENINKRNMASIMGDNFRNWADVYFHPDAMGGLDTLIVKKTAYEDFINENKPKNFTPAKFKKSLKAWAGYKRYRFNPAELCDKDGRIIKYTDDKTTEYIYIKTKAEWQEEAKQMFRMDAQEMEIEDIGT